MTPNEIAPRLAEAVLRKIEETKRIVKSEITDAIEAELLRCQPLQSSVFSMWESDDAAFRAMSRVLCGND